MAPGVYVRAQSSQLLIPNGADQRSMELEDTSKDHLTWLHFPSLCVIFLITSDGGISTLGVQEAVTHSARSVAVGSQEAATHSAPMAIPYSTQF